MARSRRSMDGVWVGVLVSAAVHLTAAGVLLGHSPEDRAPDRAALNDGTDLPDEEAERTRLGLERSDRVTVNWLGFADPTPHKGMPSEFEQAALSVAPVGVPTESPSPVEAERPDALAKPAVVAGEVSEASVELEPSAEPADEAQRSSMAAPASPETVAVAPDTDMPGVMGPLVETPLPVPLLEVVPEATEAEADGEQPERHREPVAREEPTETPRVVPAADAETPAPPEGGAGPSGADDLPGIRSDKESSPTAKLPAVTIDDWGRPAAGEGIEITPKRPHWGPTLASLARPRSPTVIIDFQRDGTVRKVSFAKDNGKSLNTGSAEVDRVLLNSVYNWRAKGEKIDALTKDGPGSVFRIRIFIRIRL